jgi:biopolymer transport protein ExbD
MQRGLLTRRRTAPGATIEMAPLIDMVFILLIFYIVSTSFVQDAGVLVNRPESRSARPVITKHVLVAITKTGTVHVTGRTIAPDESEPIADALKSMGATSVVIQADRDVPTALLLRVLDTCKAAGAETVNVAALPR